MAIQPGEHCVAFPPSLWCTRDELAEKRQAIPKPHHRFQLANECLPLQRGRGVNDWIQQPVAKSGAAFQRKRRIQKMVERMRAREIEIPGEGMCGLCLFEPGFRDPVPIAINACDMRCLYACIDPVFPNAQDDP